MTLFFVDYGDKIESIQFGEYDRYANETALQNVGGITSLGAELTADVTVTPALGLFASASFSRSRYKEDIADASEPGGVLRIEDNKAVFTPELQGFGELSWQRDGLRLAVNGKYAVDWLQLGADTLGGPLISDAVDVKHVFDGYTLTWPGGDSAVVDVTVRHLREADPDAAFAYLGNPDETSHETGSIGDEYRAAIALADRHTGMLVDAIRARPTFAQEDWLILVSTDHGRRPDGGHGGDSPEERTIFYIASGPSAQRGATDATPEIVDVAVTALAHLGIPIEPAWELDGRVTGLRVE